MTPCTHTYRHTFSIPFPPSPLPSPPMFSTCSVRAEISQQPCVVMCIWQYVVMWVCVTAHTDSWNWYPRPCLCVPGNMLPVQELIKLMDGRGAEPWDPCLNQPHTSDNNFSTNNLRQYGGMCMCMCANGHEKKEKAHMRTLSTVNKTFKCACTDTLMKPHTCI